MPSPDSLRRVSHEVRSVSLGDQTSLVEGHLRVSAAAVGEALRDPALGWTRASWVSPGDSARIVKVLDAIEPRSKGPGGGGIFPGQLGPATAQGTGHTHVLRSVAVVVAGHLPRAQEAVIDMSGPGAPLSPFGATHNLVIEFEPAPDAAWKDVDDALRRGRCRVAALLAEASLGLPGDVVEELRAASPDPRGSLPRVGAIVNLQTQGVFKDVFVRGASLAGSMPISIDDRELDDGAVVCGQYGHPGLRNPTHLHQNNPVVAALRARDGIDLQFAGLILSPEPVEQATKETVCIRAAELARELGWDGAVITKEGGGNADSDMSLKMDAMEDTGLSAVGIFAEMSGRAGDGPPVVAPPDRASAMVSSGNYDERIQLPAMDRALGGERLEIAGAAAVDAVELPAAVILGSLSPLGWGRLTASAPPQ